jgi:signal transduction histidine kinase
MSETEARYLALLRLLLAASGRALDLPAVLESVCTAVGLDGCALVRAPYAEAPEALAGSPEAQNHLRERARPLWQELVADHELESAFLQLRIGGEPQTLFAYPLRSGEEVSGCVLGLVRGRRNLAQEEDFLLALATALVAATGGVPGGAGALDPSTLKEAVERARQAAILETAIAVNHEVNNPLTAVLGNTQLLLLQSESLDEKTRKRLQDIEKSALRIKDVTQKLLKNHPHRTTDYPGGLRMLDLSDPGDHRER